MVHVRVVLANQFTSDSGESQLPASFPLQSAAVEASADDGRVKPMQVSLLLQRLSQFVKGALKVQVSAHAYCVPVAVAYVLTQLSLDVTLVSLHELTH